MEEKVKISTIMPVYNAAEFLRKSVESVLNQTLRDIELIAVDDGSTDDSLEILEEYAKKDARVKIVKQSNKTAGAARNNGIKYAVGEFVHFFDADDWLELNAYEILWNKVEDKKIDFCAFQRKKYDNVTGCYIDEIRNLYPKEQVFILKKDIKRFIYGNVVPWDKIIKRNVIVDNNLQFDEIICANDRAFYFKLLLVSKRVKVISDILLTYRINNSSSLVGDTRSKNYDCHFKSFESALKLYKNESEEILKSFIDVSIYDFIVFFNKANDQYKLNIFIQLYQYFKNMDLSILGDLSNYRWYRDYKKIINCEYNLYDSEMEERYNEKGKDFNTLIKEKKDFQNLSNEYKSQLESVQRSVSFKVGRFMTAPLRFIRKVFRKF